MIKRVLAAIAFALVAMSPVAARAQTAAEMQSMLADIGVWMQEYQAVMADANAPFLEIETYYSALDGFADGSMSARRAQRQIEGWNESAIAAMDRARAGAAALRQPPRLAAYGPEGVALQRILDATRDNLLPTVTEMERVVEASVSLGLGALDDRAKGLEARERAFYSATMLALMQNPDQLILLQENPELLDATVEEGLRYAPAFAFMGRAATTDFELHGKQIKEGDRLLLWYLASNRDETAFENPHEFDITREGLADKHQAFGGRGKHFCLGANLARLELKLWIQETIRRFPDLTLDGDPTRVRALFLNQYKSIPVRRSR